MLTGGYMETIKLKAGGPSEIEVHNIEDTLAFTILLNVIHGRIPLVPRNVSLESLAHIAILVDYYQCVDIFDLFSQMWIKCLEPTFPDVFCDDTMAWILVSWVFGNSTMFKRATEVALNQADGPISPHGYPIAQAVLGKQELHISEIIMLTITDKLNNRREKVLAKIVREYNATIEDLQEQDSCSFECDAFLLGKLLKLGKTKGICSPCPSAPFLNLRYDHLIQFIRNEQALKTNRFDIKHLNGYSNTCKSYVERMQKFNKSKYDISRLHLIDFPSRMAWLQAVDNSFHRS
jgi:hypothetical protein